jgi:hypothetical protein
MLWKGYLPVKEVFLDESAKLQGVSLAVIAKCQISRFDLMSEMA